ncbi:MAG: Lrp/AsnC family transcriptional regulator [Paludibacteraceae bacterium]|nr:Lrp/AsnC family transcriptional regulator [Paludibacteraceae bacterium]
MVKIDDTDRQILKVLQRNSKLTTKELANEVNLTATPVFERQKRLEKEGVIQKYVAVLDPEKVELGLIVFCNVKLKHHSKQYGADFVSAINAMDEVVECYNISGEYDFMMKLYVKDMKHYQNFVLNTLGEIDAIGSLHSIFVIGETKSFSGIPLNV